MIETIYNNKNLKRALIISLIFNSTLAFSNFYAKTYDSYPHMFFANHYQNNWFNTWEPRWYAGFNISTYPPFAHQILALIGNFTGLELGYSLITLTLMTLFPLAIFLFSRIFVSEKEAELASITSVFCPGILLAVYGWGQFTTLFGLFFAMFSAASFDNYIKKNSYYNLILFICFFELSVASHHFSGLIFAPTLLFVILVTELLKKEICYSNIFKRTIISISIALFFSLLVIHPILFGEFNQNIYIPHPTTMNYILESELFELFFIKMYGFIILLIPLTAIAFIRVKDFRPLFILSIFFLILGLGGTTILPKIIFGNNWLGLTYDRFNLFATISFLPLIGYIVNLIMNKKHGKKIFVIFLLFSIIFAGWVANYSNFRPQPKDVPVEEIAEFLNSDQHWKWRYLTLGFGSNDFGKLSLSTNATTIDGWYYLGRNIPELSNSGVGYLSALKFDQNGTIVLKSILNNASRYNLKYIICNDNYYNSILENSEFLPLSEKYDQVVIWVNENVPELEISEIAPANNPTVTDYLWGAIPITWLVILLANIIYKLAIKRIQENQ